jgi:uncharacterized protein (DUF305 family)
MIAHRGQGLETVKLEMAGLETAGGVNDEAKALAERIRASRTDQIQQMLTLLNS